MKKLFALCAAMLLLAGCASKVNQGASTSDTPTLVWYLPAAPQNDTAKVMEEVNKITVPKIGAKLDIRYIDMSAYKDKLNMMMASRESFDLLQGSFLVGYEDLAKRGGLMEITDDFINKSAPNIRSAFEPYLLDGALIGGKLYGFPDLQILSFSGPGFVVRKDLAEKYNLDVNSIKKTTDFIPFLEKVKQGEPNVYPWREAGNQFIDPSVIGAYTWHNTEAICVDVEKSKAMAYYDVPGIYDAALKMYDWNKRGFYRSDIATMTNDATDWASGRYAVWPISYKPGIAGECKSQNGFDWITVDLAKEYTGHWINDVTATVTSISATSKNPEKALKFIELINTDSAVFNLCAFGIENTHYSLNSDGRMKQVENSGYQPNCSFQFGNIFNGLLTEEQALTTWEETKKLHKDSKISSLLGFHFDSVDIRTELAQVDKIQQEYLVAKVNRGLADPAAYWDEYVGKLKSAGIEKIVAAYQKQIDAFLANKK